MDKQKQIEEMAKVIEEAMAKARRTLGSHNNKETAEKISETAMKNYVRKQLGERHDR